MHRFFIFFFIVSTEIGRIQAAEECFKPIGGTSCSKGKSRSLKDVEVLWVEETSTEGFPVLRNIKTRQAVPMPMGGNATDPSLIAALLGAPHSSVVPPATAKEATIIISEQADPKPGSFQIQEGVNGRRPAGPLPSCFFNKSGFSCCNHLLNDTVEKFMERLMAAPNYSSCNTHHITYTLSSMMPPGENSVNIIIQIVTSLGDFAQTVHFQGDLACKLEIDNKFFLVYGTPKFDAVGAFVTRMRM
ncbi:hypothetical protein PFISCL1PPCAC_1729 [Pristionchus fissidentatus]|uniref:Ground-like domain-containing protein n=1 Tax=Pristionchus fissidentatus TaxID=1538716 RepID=A0AAV5UT94_9BILA|nr:hypothetical protein PFISCL1PPCAC_1729 [Pristionchus fissidentatus]